MPHKRIVIVLCIVVLATLFGVVSITAQGPKPQSPSAAAGTAFTYQGQLKQNGSPVNGSVDLSFKLYSASSGGLLGTVNQTSVNVVNGLFTTLLDFGNQFDGSERWLGISIGTAAEMTPRQQLTAAPYALFAEAPWVTNGSGVYYKNGKVGIGTNNPLTQLHVTGGPASNGNNTAVFENTAIGPYASNIHFGPTGDWYIRSAKNTGKVIIQDSGGNVGIGTASPSATLDVRGPDTIPTTVAFQVADSNNAFGLKVYNGRTVFIGALNGSSTIHACYVGAYSFAGCSSAAEYVPTIDGGVGFPETADLVSIAPAVTNPYGDTHGPFAVQKSATPCDTNLLGFMVKPESGADGTKLNDHYLPLAIYGYFPAKVTLENGAIQRGDAITSSSKSGYGMKATSACKIVGYALEDADAEGTIQVFGHLSENAATEVQSLRGEVQDLKQQNARLASDNATLKQQLATMDARLSALERGAQATNTTPAPALESNLLTGLLGGGNIGSVALTGLVVVLLVRNRKR